VVNRICITKPNHIKIGQTVAEIWRFNGFQNDDVDLDRHADARAYDVLKPAGSKSDLNITKSVQFDEHNNLDGVMNHNDDATLINNA